MPTAKRPRASAAAPAAEKKTATRATVEPSGAATKKAATEGSTSGSKGTSGPRTTKAAATRKTSTRATTQATAAPPPAKKKKNPVNSSTTSRAAAAAAASLPIRDGEDPWTLADVVTVRADLEADIIRQTEHIEIVNNELAGLLRDGNDGAGRDPADVGSTNFERDQEMSLAANAREMLEQSQEALKRIDAGTYGVCENCHEPIGKGRLQAYPRANLCVRCKQRQERR